jgi:hypothetical protein
MSDSEDVRHAAAKLRTLAEAATPGPWARDYHYITAEVPSGRPGGEVIGQMTPSVVRLGTPDKANAAYVATMHPGMALAVADWLDDEAVGAQTETGEPTAHSLIIARVINAAAEVAP